MLKFSVYNGTGVYGNTEYTYRVCANRTLVRKIGRCNQSDSLIRQSDLWILYGIRKKKRLELIRKYNGYFFNKEHYVIYFKNGYDAQDFIDNVLIPCEMAYKLSLGKDDKNGK